MIIDTTPLCGLDAYLAVRDPADPSYVPPEQPAYVNLAEPRRTGVSPELVEGRGFEVEGLELALECKSPEAVWRRSVEPLLSVDVRKQLFPQLFGDPFKQRVHTIAGQDDLARGELGSLRVMDVDSRPTLVSVGEAKCRWLSPVYRLPATARFAGAAWDLATTRLTPEGAFQYYLKVHYWREGDDLDGDAADDPLLVGGAGPKTPRFRDDLAGQLDDVVAFQLEFGALVDHDAYLQERHGGGSDAPSLGRPLLRGVTLLEDRPASLTFHSLPELLAKASDRESFEAGDGLGRIWIELDVRATLYSGDSVSLTVHERGAEIFGFVSARLLGRELTRPPRE